MQLRWTLAAATLAAAAIAGPAQAEDPVADLLVHAGDVAYQAVTTADAVVDGLDRVIVVDPPATPREVRTFSSTDSITITDWGSGAYVTYGGQIRTLWDCAQSTGAGGSVVVTCHPKANTNIDWNCGVMNLNATVYSRAIDVYDHARATLRDALTPTRRSADGPNVPDPRPRQWGQAAGFVSCDLHALETGQADRANPSSNATTTMGAVTTLVCEARRSPGVASAPIAQYTVTCIDPVDPTSLL